MSDSMPVVCTIDSKNPQWTPGEMQRELFECEKKGREKFSLHYDSVWLDKFKQIQFPPFGYVADSPVMRVSEDVGLSFGFVFGPETSLPFVNGVVHWLELLSFNSYAESLVLLDKAIDARSENDVNQPVDSSDSDELSVLNHLINPSHCDSFLS
ncbi:hypothetical protein V6N12_002546 [Hibiscus sabdariffa]|uniref:Uncharacterized protein n=1 Tax=Hibiscus sabdariffa TaxID=183260 RepID=A0ABR2ASU5_9ROSI